MTTGTDTDTKLQAAYDRALAVMTAPCRFVEWKTYGGGLKDDLWYPVGVGKDLSEAWKEIDSERWIYVFRRHARTQDAAVWVDEIHLPAGGRKDAKMASAETSSALSGKEKRRDPVAIGKTISFARRINGVAMEYYFLSTRFRLPSQRAIDLMGEMPSYVNPVDFEPDDKNVVGKDGDVLLVPVLDPLTVAEHLHAYYLAANADLLRYQFVDKDANDRDGVIRRQKKVALAQLINSLQQADSSNHLVHWLNRQGIDLQDFLDAYGAELSYRRTWRARWCKLLTAWLSSKTMHLLALAHLENPEEHFLQYLIVYCMCLDQISACSEGVAHLEKLVLDGDHWIHSYVLLTSKPAQETYQVIRKATSAAIGAIKEFIPLVFREAPVTKMRPIVEAVELIAEITEKKTPVNLVTYSFDYRIEYEIKKIYVPDDEPPPLKASWKGAMTKVQTVIELVNVGIAFEGLIQAMHGDDKTKQALAFANLVGSGLDLTSLGLSVFEVGENAIGVVSFFSGLLDTFLALDSAVTAYDRGDAGDAIGAGVVAAGSFESAMAGLMLLAGIPGAEIVAIVAMAIVAVGQLIQIAFGDSDDPDESSYTQLVNYCEWGRRKPGSDASASFSPKAFAEWPGDVDAQLVAAVNVLCGFSLAPNIPVSYGVQLLSKDLREARLKGQWFPPDSILSVTFEETWDDVTLNRIWKADFKMGDKGWGAQPGAQLHIKADGDTYILRPIPYAAEAPTVIDGPHAQEVAQGLQNIKIRARLRLTIASANLEIPWRGDVEAALFG